MKGFTHTYYLVEREDYNAAAAFGDFNPDMFLKRLYSSGAEEHFAKGAHRFLMALANV